MFTRRLYHHIDWILIVAVLAICAIGEVMIYSATGGKGPYYTTQLYAIGLGVVAMAAALTIDYRSLGDKSHWLYFAIVLMLVAIALGFGVVHKGWRCWVNLGTGHL